MTLELPSRPLDGRALGAPLRVTLDLCEWQRIAQSVAEAAEALEGCPIARSLRPRSHAS